MYKINPFTGKFDNVGNTNNNMFDSANYDAFSRLRISNPLTLFSAQQTYDLCPLLYQQIVSGKGASITHDSTNRCANIAFANTLLNGTAYMQTFEYLPYQPGKSQLAFITFNFNESNEFVTKFAGYSDGVNGVEFQTNNGTNKIVLLSSTENGNQGVEQKLWNLDTLDGFGPSGIKLDIKKVQILVIDLQALYAGRVRVGFDIDGNIIYVHEFLHSNNVVKPYIAKAGLPVRCGMTSLKDNQTTSMYFLCSAVISEGGGEDINQFGYTFQATTDAVNVLDSANTHMITLRPKTTFNGFTNRARISFIDVEIYNNGNQPVEWFLVVGQALSGTTTFNDVNTTYSGTEYNTAGTLSGAYAIKIDGGFAPAGGSYKSVTNVAINSRYPITLDAQGNHRLLGSISLIMKSTSGTQPCRGAIKFREIR